MTVLVAYATAHGSTRGIAERITARLGERHVAAQARPVSEIESVFDDDGVVVGSAIHGQAWLPEAVRFMRNNATTLGRPAGVAVQRRDARSARAAIAALGDAR